MQDPPEHGAAGATITGFVIAFVAPVVSLAVAWLWDRGIIDLATLHLAPFQVSFAASVILGVVGLTLAVIAGGCRAAVVAVPALIILGLLEFYALIALSGLAGEPF
jgi:hypothetical protein